MELDFDVDDYGTQVLSGRTFENCQFSNLEIVPPVGRKVRIVNCQFLDCSTSPGTCVIGSNVNLDHVVISDLDCGDAIRISSEAELNEIIIKGRNPKSLIVQPENAEGFAMPESRQTTFQFDISEFLGDVTVVGVRGNMVRKDPNRQVTVCAKWKDEVDWKGLGIGPFSYWRIYIKKLSVFNAEEGVFSLPDSSDKHYAETIRERDILLEEAGIRFV